MARLSPLQEPLRARLVSDVSRFRVTTRTGASSLDRWAEMTSESASAASPARSPSLAGVGSRERAACTSAAHFPFRGKLFTALEQPPQGRCTSLHTLRRPRDTHPYAATR